MSQQASNISRRHWLGQCSRFAAGASTAAVLTQTGCIGSQADASAPTGVWGRKGLSDGRLMKPRAIAVSPQDELYIVDMTGRVQVYDAAGEYQRGWRTPFIKQGKPTGLAFAQDGSLLVADTHYFRVLFYSPEGQLDQTRTIGGTHGDGPGQFHFVTDVVQDQRGHFYVGQYGQIDHIQQFDESGEYVQTFGSQGAGTGQFSRPQCLRLDSEGLLWIADACNHRVQIYDIHSATTPKLVNTWGQPGAEPGKLRYPYGLDFASDGSVLISEYGNHRIQRFDRQGKSLDVFGGAGKTPGLFNSPWALSIDSQQRLHVLDSLNHRVQTFQVG